MSNSQRIRLCAPVAADSVPVAGAHTAALDLDVDVEIAKRLGLELVLLEVEVRLGGLDLEAGELIGVWHGVGVL